MIFHRTPSTRQLSLFPSVFLSKATVFSSFGFFCVDFHIIDICAFHMMSNSVKFFKTFCKDPKISSKLFGAGGQ